VATDRPRKEEEGEEGEPRPIRPEQAVTEGSPAEQAEAEEQAPDRQEQPPVRAATEAGPR
jgi:hypothetical protein